MREVVVAVDSRAAESVERNARERVCFREDRGFATALGLALVGSGAGDVAPLAALKSRFQLLFVDWVGGVVIEPGDERGFRAWLSAIRSAS